MENGSRVRESGMLLKRVGTLLFACVLLLAAGAAQAGPLGTEPGGADPLKQLSPPQRTAAKALGVAHAHLDAGRFDAARLSLASVESTSVLRGYQELLGVRLMMATGDHRGAYREASIAMESSPSDALRAAFGVLQGEALAMSGDVSGAELAWNSVLGEAGPEDEAVRQSIQLSIVTSRQRTGSLDSELDPMILLDQNFGGVGDLSLIHI